MEIHFNGFSTTNAVTGFVLESFDPDCAGPVKHLYLRSRDVFKALSEKDVEPTLKAMLSLFKLLESKELLGPERLDRLTDGARRAALGVEEDEDDGE